jgi:hypothetical protein
MRMMTKANYFKGFMGILAALLMAVLPLLIMHTSPAEASIACSSWTYYQYSPYCNPGPTTVDLFEGQNQVGTAMLGDVCCSTDISITRPADNSTNNDGNIDVSGSTVSSIGWGGNWSISLTGVAEGTHTYYAYASDYFSNFTGPSNTVTVVVGESQPATFDFISPLDGSTQVAPNTDVSGVFSQAMDLSTLTTSTFTLVKDGSDESITPVDATVSYDANTRKFTLDPSASYLEKNTKYTATIKGGTGGARDTAGNSLAGAKNELGIPLATDKVWSFTTKDDTTPPETTIDAGPTGSYGYVTSHSAGFGFTSSESDSSFECSLDGGAWSACGSSAYYYLYGYYYQEYIDVISDGSHTFEVRATDSAGNTDPTPASYAWKVDTIPPETTIDSGPSGTVDTDSASFSFSASESVFWFECHLDPSFNGAPAAPFTLIGNNASATWSTCTSPQEYTGLSEGSHILYVRATAPGGTDLTPASRTWTVNLGPPEVSSVNPADGATGVNNSTNVEATFSKDINSDTLTPSTFTLVKDGNTTTPVDATVTYDGATRKATLDPSSNLQDNTKYKATLKGGTDGAKDKAGNSLAADKVWSFTTADVSSPKVTDYSPTGTGALRDTDVRAKFTEGVEGVTADTFMLAKGASEPTPATKIASGTTVSYDPATQTATLNPYGSSSDTRLERCQRYTAKVTSGVKDEAGNPAVEKVWAFKTRGC